MVISGALHFQTAAMALLRGKQSCNASESTNETRLVSRFGQRSVLVVARYATGTSWVARRDTSAFLNRNGPTTSTCLSRAVNVRDYDRRENDMFEYDMCHGDSNFESDRRPYEFIPRRTITGIFPTEDDGLQTYPLGSARFAGLSLAHDRRGVEMSAGFDEALMNDSTNAAVVATGGLSEVEGGCGITSFVCAADGCSWRLCERMIASKRVPHMDSHSCALGAVECDGAPMMGKANCSPDQGWRGGTMMRRDELYATTLSAVSPNVIVWVLQLMVDAYQALTSAKIPPAPDWHTSCRASFATWPGIRRDHKGVLSSCFDNQPLLIAPSC